MKIKPIAIAGMIALSSLSGSAQTQERAGLSSDYEELTDGQPHDGAEVWGRMRQSVAWSWGDTDTRYPKFDLPVREQTALWQTKAWRGERVNGQAVLWTNRALEAVTVSASDLRGTGGTVIPAEAVRTHFVRYVMTDELNPDGGGCGHRPDPAEWDSSLVADVLDTVRIRNLAPCTVQPVWVQVAVPREAEAGRYRGTLTVSGKNLRPMKIRIQLDVADRTLPEPKEWAFHLDLWQNPYAVARYYGVPLWSRAHFDAMLPSMKMLAEAGQKVVTASIMHRPWAGQTYDPFDSMIAKTKRTDSTWTYDYTLFDRWVDFMTNEAGIDRQINCYTLIPWALSFDYFDPATGRVQFLQAEPGSAAYRDYWLPFLTDFARHLREKGWFGRTAISMDERPLKAMQEAIRLIKEADPEFKITLAGNYHDEIQADLYDLSIPYTHRFPAAVKAAREQAGRISTVYICCTESFPNTFTFSAPAEAAWLPVHAVAGGYDGVLRWAYNSWTADPLRDSRFHTWAAGDCYLVYPGGRSSIRFERLIEGIQQAEKIRILRERLAAAGDEAALAELNETVALFTPEGIERSGIEPEAMLVQLKELLGTL